MNPTLILYALAFLSGAAALMYELTWAKMLALTFGSTTISAAAVIAGFMGGMGIGAWCCHLISERVDKPLKFYGWLEISIAITTALLTPLFYTLPEIFAGVARDISNPTMVDILRFASVFFLLLIPSMLMGATFPALCMVMMRSVRDVDRHLGLIYGLNTLGGAVGVCVGGLFLIEALGLNQSVRVANGLNVMVGLAAFLLLRTSLGQSEVTTTKSTDTAIATRLSHIITGIVLLVSGLTTLCYEILWFRSLRFIVGNSTHALSVVLVIFLLGLGAGSLLLRYILKRRQPERDLATCQWMIAVFAMWAIVCETLILTQPSIYQHVSIFLSEVRFQPWGWRLMIISLTAIIMMLPATLCMGLSFPLASRLLIGDMQKLSTRIGYAYLLSNIGSITGAILAAVVLLPWLGITGSTKVCVVANMVLGFIILLNLRDFKAMRIRAIVCTVLVVVLIVITPRSLGLYGEESAGKLVFEREHDQGTVHVRASFNDPTKQVMLVDGCKIGCSDGYPNSLMFRKQIALVHLPMVLDAGIQHTLNVGLGSASTLKTLSRYASVKSLDCVEINPGVVEGSRFFRESSVLKDPRVSLYVDDAVHFLLRSNKTYDLIISDGKQDPFFSGNATLLCKEYYNYAKNRLSDDGLFVQWISLSTLMEDFQIILRTLMSEFDYVETFTLLPNSAFMIASQKPIWGRTLRNDPDQYDITYRELGVFGIDHREALLSRWVAGTPQIQSVMKMGPMSTWDHLILDYTPFKAYETQWRNAERDNLAWLTQAARLERDDLPAMLYSLQNRFVESTRFNRNAYLAYLSGNMDDAFTLISKALESNPYDRSVSILQGIISAGRNK